MLTPDELKDLTVQEGVRFFVYDDATGQPIRAGSIVRGNPSIGIGRNLAATGLSATEIDLLLSDDWGHVVTEAGTYPWFSTLDDARQYVVCNMIFNMGARAFAGFKLLHEMLAAGNWTGAANAMIDSKWATEVPSRAADLKVIMTSGVVHSTSHW